MATLKKPIKKKDGGKPGTVLIIFLVFFILVSIGLGVFAYYGYEGQAALKDAAKNAKLAETGMKEGRDYRLMLQYMLASSLGQDLDEADKVAATELLEHLSNAEGKYKANNDRAAFAKLFDDMKKDGLTFDANAKKFTDNYRAKLKAAQADLDKTRADLAAAKKEAQAAQTQFTVYQKKIDDYYTNAVAKIGKDNNTILTAVTQKWEAFKALEAMNKEIQDQKLDAEAKLAAKIEELNIEKARVNKILEEKKNAGLEIVPTRKNTEEQALMLDLTRGVPLWDRAVGKVTRVDLDRRQVFINLGSAQGVRPELSFNVFADDGKGNANRFLKGTLEVIRVIDGQTSLCRITSLYDATGTEIALNDPGRGRAAREVESAINEGDLLFNMFWHARVAIAGVINPPGISVDAPSEQMRQLATFIQLLERMSIHTDGYLDLTDGQAKGAITARTRFLILGEAAQPKNPNDDAQKESAKQINDGIAAMKKEAIEKGLFLISADNFAVASGYRIPRNALNNELTKFRPGVPVAGASSTGLLIQRGDRPGVAAPAPMPMPEKKEPEAKEKKEPEAKEKEAK